jgi:hypothetical protein
MSFVDPIWALRAAEGFVLVVGAAIAYASLRAYRRTRDPALGLLGFGFLLVTVAAALSGAIYEVLTHDLLTAWTVSAVADCLGFSLILYSILRPQLLPATGPSPGADGTMERPADPTTPRGGSDR